MLIHQSILASFILLIFTSCSSQSRPKKRIIEIKPTHVTSRKQEMIAPEIDLKADSTAQKRSQQTNQKSEFETTSHKLTDQEFNKLSIREKLQYAVNHPEGYRQICFYYPMLKDANSKLISKLPEYLDGKFISKRQLDALKANRDSSIFYLNAFLKNANSIPRYWKALLVNLHATECIPNIIRIAKNDTHFDSYNLTILLNIMRYEKFDDFMKSDYCAKFYTDYDFKAPPKFIPLTPHTKDSIFTLAEQCYNESIPQKIRT